MTFMDNNDSMDNNDFRFGIWNLRLKATERQHVISSDFATPRFVVTWYNLFDSTPY
jgi:hypothetical protein